MDTGLRSAGYPHAATLSEIGVMLTEEISEHTPFDKVLLVGGLEGHVDAVARGVPPEEVAAFLEDVRASDMGRPEAGGGLRNGNGEPPLGSLRSLASPVVVPAAGAPRGGFAAVIVDATGHHPAVTAVHDAVRTAAPFVHRCVEVDALRAQVRSLRAWGAWLHGTLDSLPHPVLVIDHQGRVLVVNRRAEDLLVTGGAEGLGGGREVTMNNLRFSAYLAQAALDEGRGPADLTLLDPSDGSELDFEVDCYPLHAEEDRSRIFLLRHVADRGDHGRSEQEQRVKGAG